MWVSVRSPSRLPSSAPLAQGIYPTVKADFPSDAAYAAAAWMLMAETRVMKAFAKVEGGPEGAFLDTDEPVILFERHVFSRLTNHVYDRIAPDISNIIGGGYGKYSEQHGRLQRASELDHTAALKSTSWGLFQIMGFNHAQVGFPGEEVVNGVPVGLQRFINAMYRSVDDHLRAFVMFIRSNTNLVDALRAKDWPKCALYYNGIGYKKFNYDVKLGTAYAELGA